MGIIAALGSFFSKILRKQKPIYQQGLNSPLNSMAVNTKPYLAGTVIGGRYMRAKKDQAPLILVLFSGQINTKLGSTHMTHGININVLDNTTKEFLIQQIYSMRNGTVPFNGRFFYDYLKNNRPLMIKTAYRTYYTYYLNANVVSPGMFRSVIPFYNWNSTFVLRLNYVLFGKKALNKNVIHGEDNINKMIETSFNEDSNIKPGQ